MRQVKWSQPTRRRDGHIGARATISIRNEGGADGHYNIDTHGMNPARVAAEVGRIHAFHDARADRLVRFRALQADPLLIGDTEYRIVDLSIRYPPNAAHCQLYIDVRKIDVSSPVEGFPMRILYPDIAAIPSNTEIVGIIRTGIESQNVDMKGAHERFITRVAAELIRRGGD